MSEEGLITAADIVSIASRAPASGIVADILDVREPGSVVVQTKLPVPLKGPRIILTQNDCVLPVCKAGTNRSQIMYVIASALMNALGAPSSKVVPPHGTENGWMLEEDNTYAFTNALPYVGGPAAAYTKPQNAFELWGPANSSLSMFELVLGAPRVPRIGTNFIRQMGVAKREEALSAGQPDWDRMDEPMDPAKQRIRAALNAQFDSEYFSPTSLFKRLGPKGGKAYFITFADAHEAIVANLERLAAKEGRSLDHVVVVALTEEMDPTADKNPMEAIIAAVERYASLFYLAGPCEGCGARGLHAATCTRGSCGAGEAIALSAPAPPSRGARRRVLRFV